MPTGVYIRTKEYRESRRGAGNPMYGRHAWNSGINTGLAPKSAFKKGNVPYNKGVKGYYHSGSFKDGHPRIGLGSWKGDNVGYGGLHDWVRDKLGKPKKCEHCGTKTAKKYEWANTDHSYKRNLNDWIRLCTRCHRKYDIENNSVLNNYKKHAKGK